MTARPQPRLFTIPPGVPFLPTLVEALVACRLVPAAGDDPLAAAAATIFVPTRRAARALRAAFAEATAGRATLLPSIRPLGEFEDDLVRPADRPDPPIDPFARRLLLAELVARWKATLPRRLADHYAEGIVVPATTADALWLADDLARLIDDVETAGGDWRALEGLAGAEMPAWWEVSLEFLSIVAGHWPSILAEQGRSDPSAWRNATIRAEARRLAQAPPAGPIVVAGSTGSIPAIAELIAVIARLPMGAVVLPGLDLGLDEGSRRALADHAHDPTVWGHPQQGLARLLARIEATVEDVTPLAAPSPSLSRRGLVVAQALRPAAATADWPSLRRALGEAELAEAMEGVTLVEAASERDEALAVAVALREAIEDPDRVAALVTPDRALARRVATELQRFGITCDDSGGTGFALTAQGSLLSLVLAATIRPGDPVALVALLKHRLLRLGRPAAMVRAAAETLELVALRGGSGRPDIAEFGRHAGDRAADRAKARPHRAVGRLPAAAVDAALALASALERAVAPLAALRAKPSVTLAEAALAITRTIEALGIDEAGSLADLYEGEAGAMLAEILRQPLAHGGRFAFAADELPEVFAALNGAATVRPRAARSSRIFLWGALEARLQTVDTLVVGGLNEGHWPRQPDPGGFLSRTMQAALGLDPPERLIGLSAHDFQMAAGAPRLVLTRAQRAGDAPAVASRWLERLAAFAGTAALAPARARGDRLLALADALDRAPRQPFAARPDVKPPLALRPARFSVTEIETLRRDPYALYARRILRLDPLDPLLADPGPAERGLILHAALARFVTEGVVPDAPDAFDRLVGIGRAVFAEAALPDDVRALWWPRFLATAAAYLDWERPRPIVRRLAEVAATPTAIAGATLTARADRIDLRRDGGAEILDFKTGSTPSKRQAHRLIAPQLALEAGLLMRGAFEAAGTKSPEALAYVRLKADGTVRQESVLEAGKGATASKKTGVALADEAWTRLAELLAWFAVDTNGYRSRVLPFREGDTDGDYDHLARVLEWSAGGDDGEDEA